LDEKIEKKFLVDLPREALDKSEKMVPLPRVLSAKLKKMVDLPRAKGRALGKGAISMAKYQLCREASWMLSAKTFFKKKLSFCREPSWRLSAKT
jgi:hypothetical protein